MPPLDTLQATSAPNLFEPSQRVRPWLRVLLLLLSGALMLPLLLLVGNNRPPQDSLQGITPLMQLWMLCYVPYIVACGFVLFTKPATGRWQWVELGCIFVGALLFRAVLLPYPPGLSHDSWRYLWDARVTLHGYSPYAVVPSDMRIFFLRDFLYGIIRFRIQPTIYPPAAQAVFILSYLLAPSNLVTLKGIFVLFELLTCVIVALLLVRRGMDPRRVVLYAWCPLPIVDFAIEGHLDALPVALIVLAIFCAGSSRRGMRVVTGIVIGLATLTKIYPIVLLAVVMRKRGDWGLLLACAATIVIGYIPYLILGHGQVFGFFSIYAGEQGGNAGPLQLGIYILTNQWLGVPINTTIWLQHVLDVLFLGGVGLVVFVQRQRKRLSMEAGALILFGAVFAISSHIFSWYTTALLPLAAVLFCPPWQQGRLSGKGIAVLMVCYFCFAALTGYFFGYLPNWYPYYNYAYIVTLAGLVFAAIVGYRTNRYLSGRDR